MWDSISLNTPFECPFYEFNACFCYKHSKITGLLQLAYPLLVLTNQSSTLDGIHTVYNQVHLYIQIMI